MMYDDDLTLFGGGKPATLGGWQMQQGGQFAGKGGNSPPMYSGDVQHECDAAKTSVALFDLSHWTTIELTGSARQGFLHGFCTNDIKKLEPGPLLRDAADER